MADPLLSVFNLGRRFGNLYALREVSFTLQAGEVLGVVGRRGSGKSTLLQILSGAFVPTTGKILLQGQTANLSTTENSRRAGIEMVHQSPRLVDSLDILQNIFLGRELLLSFPPGVPDWNKMSLLANEILAEFDPPQRMLSRRVDNLSDEMKQIVAIARALCVHPRILLLDDSLSPLSYPRQQLLMKKIQQLSEAGVAVIISSDNLNHLLSSTNRILVLYEGRLTADRVTSECTPRDIVELIVGNPDREQVTPIIWALSSYHQAQQQTEDLRLMQTKLRKSLEEQDSLNRQLIVTLNRQLEALDHLNSALQSAQRRLMTEREEERKAVARELHDQVIQDLLSFNYRLEEAESGDIPDKLKESLVSIRNGIRQVVSDLRQLCSDLRPPTIDSHGLQAALRSFTQEWSDRSGIHLELIIDPTLTRLPESMELSIFRIVQEALNNVQKHAAAKLVRIILQWTPSENLMLRIRDNGRGPDQSLNLAELTAQKHFGIVGISERVALLGGTMQMISPPHGGFELVVEIPSPYPSV